MTSALVTGVDVAFSENLLPCASAEPRGSPCWLSGILGDVTLLWMYSLWYLCLSESSSIDTCYEQLFGAVERD